MNSSPTIPTILASLLLLLATCLMSRSEACCLRTGRDRAFDGVMVLRQLMFNAKTSNKEFWFLPNALQSVGDRETWLADQEQLTAALLEVKALQELDLGPAIRDVMQIVLNDSTVFFQLSLGDPAFDANDMARLRSLHARLKAAILVDKPFIEFSKIPKYKFAFFSARYFYGYWKEHIKDRCICCSAKVDAVEKRVLVPDVFRENAALECCPK